MKKLKWFFLSGIVLLGLTACMGDEDNAQEVEKEEVMTPVEAEKIQKGDMSVDQTFYGRVSSDEMTPIMSLSNGQLVDVDVENGDTVEEGDILTRVNPGYIAIEAPHDGVLYKWTGKEEAFVSNTDPIGYVVSLDPLTVTVSATEQQLKLFQEGENVDVTIQDERVKGTIVYIPVMPDDTGLYPVEISIDNEEETVLPGMMASVNVVENRIENALLVPTASIVEDDDETFIFIIEGNTVKKVPVDVLEMQTEHTAIKGEVKEGDQVVTKGHVTLTDGSKVELMKEDK